MKRSFDQEGSPQMNPGSKRTSKPSLDHLVLDGDEFKRRSFDQAKMRSFDFAELSALMAIEKDGPEAEEPKDDQDTATRSSDMIDALENKQSGFFWDGVQQEKVRIAPPPPPPVL